MSQDGLPRKGEILAGKFEVEDVLGAGGMGVVVAARHLILRRRVAVKFLSAQAARLPEASARFLREARAAAAIQSEHVARVIDVGTLDDGAPYMVMEFLAGTDFSRVLKQRGPLPVAEAVDYVLQACEAIAEAHAHGIAHRDLKPANLFLTTHAEGSPLVKVLDFGLSKIAAEDGAAEGSLTATGFVAGSPFYMAPEQVRSLKSVDQRADLWALGVILYELLTDHRPFDGPSLTAVCASIIADAPAPMRSRRPEIPEALDQAVLRCLEKNADLRMPSVAALAQALAPFAPPQSLALVEKIGRLLPGSTTAPLPAEADVSDAAATLVLPGAAAPPAGPAQATERMPSMPDAGPPPGTISATGAEGAWGQTQRSAPRRPKGWLAAAAVVVVAAIGGVAVWMLRAPAVESQPAAPAASAAPAAVSAVASAEPAAPSATASAEPAVSAEPTAVVTAEPKAVASAAPHVPPRPRPAAPAPAVAKPPPAKVARPAKPVNPWD